MSRGRFALRAILALVTGILLGTLGVLLMLRARVQGAREALPDPTLAITESAAPAAAPEPSSGSASGQLPPVQTAAPAPEEASPGPEAAVENVFRDFLARQNGRWDLCFLSLPDGELLSLPGEGEPMVSASLIKLYIMGAVFEKTESGLLDAEAVRDDLFAMITVSDNGAANRLVLLLGEGDEQAGMAAVNDWCRRQGYAGTRQNRLMLADNGLQNYTSAIDCARLLRAVYRGECVSESASRQMLDILLQQRVNDRLPLGLPEGTPIAHKTGDLIGLCWGDVGIVFSPGGDYILCVISDGQAPEGEAKSAAAALSAEIYGILNPED